MVDNGKSNNCINKKISFEKCEAINIEGTCSVRDVLTGGYIRSNNNDPEILLNIVFHENLNLNGILIEAPNKEKLPNILKIFVNNPTIDIGDVENLKPVETIKFDSTTIGKKITLKVAKFRNISSLNIYMSNTEIDQIQINNIQIFGNEGEKMDFKEIKNVNL